MSKVGYLVEAREERFNTKRAWFAKAYRIVNEKGGDMIQPWPTTKKMARDYAKSSKITLVEE